MGSMNELVGHLLHRVFFRAVLLSAKRTLQREFTIGIVGTAQFLIGAAEGIVRVVILRIQLDGAFQETTRQLRVILLQLDFSQHQGKSQLTRLIRPSSLLEGLLGFVVAAEAHISEPNRRDRRAKRKG